MTQGGELLCGFFFNHTTNLEINCRWASTGRAESVTAVAQRDDGSTRSEVTALRFIGRSDGTGLRDLSCCLGPDSQKAGLPMTHLHGSCLCGGVTIRIPDRLGFAGYCHCAQCRKWSGSPFSAGGLVDSLDFEITQGARLVSYYASSEHTTRGFCSRCGSSLFSIKHQRGKHIVRLGILDDVPTQRPDRHIFVTHKAPWFEITDDLEQHEDGV